MLDLNEKKAARLREAKGEPVTVSLGDEVFELPVELPLEAVDLMASAGSVEPNVYYEHIRDFAHALLGDEQFAKFMKIASREDLSELVTSVPEQYGLSQGESSASPES